MEQAQRDRLSELVEELTTSGQPELNQDKMKEIKKICKVSTDCLDHIYHSVMSQLNQDHAEIRLSAFQIARELFSRSHHFRNLLVDNFQEFLELTVETDLEQPLPPPKEVAKKLKVSAIQTVQSWQASYGSAYKKLALGYHFLKQVKKVDFQDVEARSVAERRREEERQRRMDRIYRERVEAATRDMEGNHFTLLLLNEVGKEEKKEEGQEVLREGEMEEEMEDEEQGGLRCTEGQGEDGLDEDSFIRNSGLISHSYSLDISVDPDVHVKETEDNEAVISTILDLDRLITTKHLPAVQSWVQVSTNTHTHTHYNSLLTRKLNLLKGSLPILINLILFNFPHREGSCPILSSDLTQSATSPSQQPCLGPSTSTVSGPSTSVSSSDKRALEAPVVPFGLDLYYWGQDQPSAGKIIKSASQHQFWVPCEMEEEVENEELSAEGRSRYISFPGTFTPVSHYCRAPLANGTLCQRQDRVKCPFHGPIIPRDQEGRPSRQEDRLREEKEKRRRMEEQPDWRDVELMREIEAATGEDLGSSRLTTKGKGKKRKYPNLSDLKQNANTARSRLQRKVFSKSSMRRVAEAMSKADRRKHDKFSNQFNYSLN
uniref:UV-stimulated scaffold protein A n=1 Tax=Myripristis murdjan TaxID=586833 RepID=A0A667XF32_9TELE